MESNIWILAPTASSEMKARSWIYDFGYEIQAEIIDPDKAYPALRQQGMETGLTVQLNTPNLILTAKDGEELFAWLDCMTTDLPIYIEEEDLQPAKPAETAEPAMPAETAEPAMPAETATPAGETLPATPAKPDTPAEQAETAETAKPAQNREEVTRGIYDLVLAKLEARKMLTADREAIYKKGLPA